MFAQSLTDACGPNPGFFCELVFDQSGSERLAELTDLAARPVKVVLILFGAWILSRIIRQMIHRTTERWIANQQAKAVVAEAVPEEEGELGVLEATRRRLATLADQAERGQQRAKTLGDVLESTASLVIFAIATMIVLAEFGVNLAPLIAGAGILGVAAGFGAQSLVKDFLSGIFMLVEDQYGVGDIIDVGEVTGVVEEVKLRTTQLRDVHGTLWFIPNGEIHRVANKSQAWARTVMDIEVAYDTDLRHAMTVIKDVADQLWQEHLENATILEEPEIWGVESFGPSAIAIRLVLKVEPAEQWSTAREIRKRLKYAFDEAGIEIPFPQQTVWWHDRSGEVKEHEAHPATRRFPPTRGAEGEH